MQDIVPRDMNTKKMRGNFEKKSVSNFHQKNTHFFYPHIIMITKFQNCNKTSLL